MIGTPTTLVVGAGASKPYGLPVGTELFDRAKSLKPASDLYQLLRELHPEPERLDRFLADLRAHPAHSIDAFLETRQTEADVMSVGRSVLAGLMGVALQKKPTQPANADWMGYLIGRMAEGAPTWKSFMAGNASVRFVTFNFDTLVEQKILDDLGRRYRHQFGAVEAKETLEKIRVVHVHGRLPEWFPSGPIVSGPFNYLGSQWLSWMKEATQVINVTLDSIDETTLAVCRESVRNAAVLCFLGFSYHPDNLSKLGVPSALKKDTYQTVFGSAFGLSEGERARVRARLEVDAQLGDHNDDCLGVLRRFDILRD